MLRRSLTLLLCLSAPVARAAAAPKSEVWVYTSIYKEFIAPIEAAFEAKYPEYDVQVFQGGSEKIQAKLEAELVAKKPQADILLTSDPFWSTELKDRGLLATRPGHEPVETNYYSLMVLIAHKDFPEAKRPKSFQDLARPELKGLIQSGSPLESGTTFSTVAYLSKKYGWDFFAKLKANGLASAGGNSVVIQKVESGEKKVGIVLLENALAARKRGSPIEVIYPEDGSIPIPSVQVVLKDAKNPAGAGKFADFVLSEEGQKLLLAGFMYAVLPSVPAPEGAKPLKEVTAKSTPWTAELTADVAKNAKDIKKTFAGLILE
jgi:iron(III) transport system substrate-binding protein